jgi:hypothetical protein
MRITILLIALLLVGCSKSVVELRAERETLMEQIAQVRICLVITTDKSYPYEFKGIGVTNRQEAKDLLADLEDKLTAINAKLYKSR